jgi:hypothetical protein
MLVYTVLESHKSTRLNVFVNTYIYTEMETEMETQPEIRFGEKPTDEQMETIMRASDVISIFLDQDKMQGLPEGGYYDYVFKMVPDFDQDTATMLYHLCVTTDEQEINKKLHSFETLSSDENPSPLANLLLICSFLQMRNATIRLHKYVAGLTSRTDEELNRIFPCESPVTKQQTLDEFGGVLTRGYDEIYRVLSNQIAPQD